MLNERFFYGNWKTQYKFLPYLKDREFIFLPSKHHNANQKLKKRNMRVHNAQSFQFWLNNFRLFFDMTRSVNFYYSMARFKDGIPPLYDKGLINEKKAEKWNKNAFNHICGYDMLIDIDAGNFSEMPFACDTARDLKIVFDKQDVPYHLRFSGMGFHFVIPYRFFPQNLSFDFEEEDNIYIYMKKIAERLYNDYSEMVDYTIYDSRRIAKLPYSLSIYDSGSFVCCPVDIMKNFDLQDYKLEKFNNDILIDDVLHNPNGSLNFFQDGTT